MTDKKIIQESLKLVKLKSDDKFYDLGCGRGDVLIEAAKLGAQSIGFEISPYYYIYAKARIIIVRACRELLHFPSQNLTSRRTRRINFGDISIQYRDINKIDLSKADVVYCYLIPKFLKKLAPKFKKGMKLGSRLISIGFPIPELKNEKKYNIHNRKVFIYWF